MPQDGKKKLGVQITPFLELVESYKKTGHIFYRSVECPDDCFSNEHVQIIDSIILQGIYNL